MKKKTKTKVGAVRIILRLLSLFFCFRFSHVVTLVSLLNFEVLNLKAAMNDLKLATGINRPWLQSLSGNYFGGNCPYFSIPFISFCTLLSSNVRIYFNLCALHAGFSYDLKTSGISNQIVVATSW